MDSYDNQDTSNHLNYRRNPTNPRGGRSNISGYGNPPVDSNANATSSANAEASPQTTPSQHSDGFTMIQPNESRRSLLKMTAQKGEEELQRWKEANRPSTVLLTPERLGGGDVSLAEARERQPTERQSKLQRKLKKEEMDRRRRQEDEEEIQKMKAKQREKAERLEERSRQDELRRRQQLRQDQLRRTDTFLQRFEWTGPAPVASSSATHTSSWLRAQEHREAQREEENTALQLRKDEQRRKSEALEEKQRKEATERRRETELEHRRVNSAFLDQLEARRTGSEREQRREVEHLPSVFEDYRDQHIQRPGAQEPLTPVNPDPEESSSGRAGDPGELPRHEPEPDYDWAVMKLQSGFPSCERVFLEDILLQCDGDYQQAYALLCDSFL